MPHAAIRPTAPRLSSIARRAVLAVALALGVALGGGPLRDAAAAGDRLAQAGTAAPGATAPDGAARATPPDAPRATPPDAPRATPPAAASSEDEPAATNGRTEVIVGEQGVVIQKRGARTRVGRDPEFDSFDEFVNRAPWLAGVVFLTLVLVFVVPLLVVALLVWYKIRKTRMQNEAMIRLAEKGAVPLPEAMATVAGNVPPGLPASAAPLYEQARELRRRTAWSDLRKGVILCAIGLAFLVSSGLSDGEGSWIGFILLFLGLGYGVLWYFEGRRAPAPRDAGPPPAGGA